MLRSHTIQFRVRYQETDAQGHVHHANYLSYFEIGRVEQMRASGYCYRELEAQGFMLVIAQASCRYMRPAVFDDLLELQTTTTKAAGARLEHTYEIRRDGDTVVTGETVIACIDPATHRVRRLPDWLVLKDD